jgi:hypothetical protein
VVEKGAFNTLNLLTFLEWAPRVPTDMQHICRDVRCAHVRGPADLLELIDRTIADEQRVVADGQRRLARLLELRAAVAGTEEFTSPQVVADDLAPEHLLDTHSASARFNYPRNTLAKWCRDEGLGVRRGGRWLISVPKLQRRLNGS